MAETCIVCLSDLRQQDIQDDASSVIAAGDHAAKKRSLRDTRLTYKSSDNDDDEIIAHLLPCKHNLHNACLKPWVERANSCPICRATFNQVELSASIGGEVIDTYAVQDKVQEQIFDPTPFLVDEDAHGHLDMDAIAPCIICDMIDETHESMYCDGCDGTVHVFCAGYADSPEVWYCSECQTELGIPEQPSARQRGRSRRSTRRGRQNDAAWARVWQAVSHRLDLDLDFPFSDDAVEVRTEEQRREFGAWERRFLVADRQRTSARRLRGIAARLQQYPPPPIPRPAPESQEEIRAWNAFEKARDSQGHTNSRRKRQRTESPDSAHDTTEQPQLKRPRLRRPPTTTDAAPQAESSTAAARRAGNHPTFLSSLLREVEQKPIFAASPNTSELNGRQSPRDTSPARSPSSSGPGTPRGSSPSPAVPTSPPLCSTVAPALSPPGFTFSPFSPALRKEISYQNGINEDAEDLASKEEIQRMVKLVLKPKYREKQLTKDQYTDINRDVSRKMYELVGDTSFLSDEKERAHWQGIAEQEVLKAVSTLDSQRQEVEAVAS